MKNQNIIYLVLTVILIGGVVYAFSQMDSGKEGAASDNGLPASDRMEDSMEKDERAGSDDAMMEDKQDGTMMNGDDKVMDDDKSMDGEDKMMDKSSYQDYSQEAFDESSDMARVIFFYASWCPTCRPADADLTKNSDKIPDGVTVFKANYDTEKALKSKYGVTYQHTFVQVDESGDLVTKWSGGSTQELVENVVL